MVPNTKHWAASQRMYILAEQLMNECNSVEVIHSNYGFFGFFGKKPTFSRKSVDIKPNFFQRSQEHNQKVALSGGEKECEKNKSIDGALRLLKKVFGRLHTLLERTIYNDWNSGVYAKLWCIQAWPEIKRAIKDSNITHVIISGPYFTTFSLCEKIRLESEKIKIVLDYRDPWNFLPSGSSFFSRHKERKYLNISDKVTVFSDTFRCDIVDKYQLPKEKVIAMYNGYDEVSWSKVTPNVIAKNIPLYSVKGRGKMVVSYIASNIVLDDEFRDVTNLLRALARVKNPSIIECNLIGVNNTEDFQDFNLERPLINLVNRVSHMDSLTALSQSDIVIILSTEENPSLYTITGKLFDCIKSGAFVLGISNNNNIEYNKIINKYGFGGTVNNDIDQLTNTFDSLIDLWKENNMPLSRDKGSLEIFSRQYQNKKLIDYIKGN